MGMRNKKSTKASRRKQLRTRAHISANGYGQMVKQLNRSLEMVERFAETMRRLYPELCEDEANTNNAEFKASRFVGDPCGRDDTGMT